MNGKVLNFNTPVLFLIFNRFESVKYVFEKIKLVKPAKLYIASDGPRSTNNTDKVQIKKIRDYLLAETDWECELFTLFREENLGCKAAVSGAISWFFENEAEGIILEDDCLPSPQFFTFCENLLEKYRHDDRIRHISGSSMGIVPKIQGDTYHFSKLTNVWGWASWRRVWNDYDVDLKKLEKFIETPLYKGVFQNDRVTKFIMENFLMSYQHKIDTWDFQYFFCNLINNGLSIQPNYNLITNIGFNNLATHTTDTKNIFANMALENFDQLVHPTIMIPDLAGDIAQIKLQMPSLYDRYRQKLFYLFKTVTRS